MSALPQYLLWWKLVEECSHKRRSMDIQWFTTNGVLMNYESSTAVGAYRPWPDRIALAYPDNGPIVRHEMLHALLERDGHPLNQFAGSCNGFVNFEPPQDFGVSAAELASAATLPADSALTVSLSTFPAVPSLSLFGGHFVFVVTATNTLAHSVVIPHPGAAYVQFADSAYAYGAAYNTTSRVFFRAGQSRRVIIDAHIAKAGAYLLQAAYAHAKSPLTTVVVER
jgi:hypothetical protein